MKNYRKTKLACYLGFVTQAIAANFAPLLFLKFHSEYGISIGSIALIPGVFFFTQLLVDLFCVRFADIFGYRECIVASEVCSAVGLAGLALLPELFSSPFTGIIICVIIYAVGSGLIEVLCSPIMEACPFENKAAAMSLLHSFYCWGSFGTIVISSVFFAVFGTDSWKWLAVIFALVPAVNIYNFATCPIEHFVEEGTGLSFKELFKRPLFFAAIVLMVCSGASELAMAQWASAYAESALGLSKALGDLAGPCMFAVAMGICRVLYGKYGEKVELKKFMAGSGALCVVCYVLASFSDDPITGLIGCIVCGFSVGIMWPGTLSISAKEFPQGGTAMFALLAMAGDLGGSLGPAIVGRAAEVSNGSISAGIRAGIIFPCILCLILTVLLVRKTQKGK